MAKGSKMSTGKLVLTILVIALVVATCLPLFLNVWNSVIRLTIGNASQTEMDGIGGFFDDYDAIKTGIEGFMPWTSMVAGIALIVALVAGAVFVLGAIMKMVGSKNALMDKLMKLAAIVMLVCGIVIIVMSIMFVLPKVSAYGSSVSTTFGIGAWIAMIAPTLAGVFGLMLSKN